MNKHPVRIPKYRRHKSTGRAIITLNNRDVYLGAFESGERSKRPLTKVTFKQARQAWELACALREEYRIMHHDEPAHNRS